MRWNRDPGTVSITGDGSRVYRMLEVARSWALVPALAASLLSGAQTIDSVHIFMAIPKVRYNTSLAETIGWRSLHAGKPYVSIGPEHLAGLNEGLAGHKPGKHTHMDLPRLSHIGFVYYRERAHAFCLSQDEGLMIDLTARRQFRIEDWAERMKLKAALVALGL